MRNLTAETLLLQPVDEKPPAQTLLDRPATQETVRALTPVPKKLPWGWMIAISSIAGLLVGVVGYSAWAVRQPAAIPEPKAIKAPVVTPKAAPARY